MRHSALASSSFPIWAFQIRAVRPLLLVLPLFFGAVLGQCPRKADANEAAEGSGQPALRPAKQFIQTTFIHRDSSDEDSEFAQFIAYQLAELRPRLQQQAYVTLDNENIECDGGPREHHRCREYPLSDTFHFLIVEDSRTGAAVYSIPRERNWEEAKRGRTIARVEAALLDALSRHSSHPLMPYASEAAANALGFVRELGVAELEQFIRQNHAALLRRSPSAVTSSTAESIFTRSPTELRLLNERILQQRRVDFAPVDGPLLQFQGPELAELLESEQVKALFVLFWNEASPLSVHAYNLWARAGERWKRQEAEEQRGTKDDDRPVVLGSVACHEEQEVCRAFAISHTTQQHQLFAYRDGHKVAHQLGIGDEHFLLEWIGLVLSGPLVHFADQQRVEGAKKSLADGEALTVARFRSEQQEEFKRFRKAATLLHGRYRMGYWLDEKQDVALLSTFRRDSGRLVELPFSGTQFGTRPLLHHITHASVPDILDIGRGFTTDLVLGIPALLLLHNGNDKDGGRAREWFAAVAREMRAIGERRDNDGTPLRMLRIDVASEEQPSAVVLAELKLNAPTDLPALCHLASSEIRCAIKLDNLDAPESVDRALVKQLLRELDEEETNGIWTSHFQHNVALDPINKPHPLAYIQLAHIESLFGPQQIQLQPEPIREQQMATGKKGNPHDFSAMDPGLISGCPMMAHMQNNMRDEL